MRDPRGSSLPELVILLGVVAVVTQAAAPEWVRWRQRQRVRGAAQELALLATALKVRAATTGRAYAIRFRSDAPELEWTVIRDGDGDGVRSADLRSGVDQQVAGPYRLSLRYPGIQVGLLPDVATLRGGARPPDGVAFGVADLASLRPQGTTSSGSVYLCDRWRDCAAVRLYGASGRVAVWWYRPQRRSWSAGG